MPHLVLVVDDEADLRVTYDRLLRRQGYRVVCADSRRQGLFILESEAVALVVSDLRLPDGDGLDVVRAARTAPVRTPAIVVTGFPSAESRQAAMAAGASAFVVKPFSASGLAQVVSRVLGSPPL